MIHFYHGLFGSPTDWFDDLRASKSFYHDLYIEGKDELLGLKTSPEDILVGYSLGGRIALEIARRNHFNLSHLILLSAHPGLLPTEREGRKAWEDEVLKIMQTASVEDFRNYWNGLNLFNSSQITPDLSEAKLAASSHLFNGFRLSEMPNASEYLSQHRDKITWVIGENDKKYKDLIKDRVIPHGINVLYFETDHRVLQAKLSVKELLVSKGIL